MATFTWNGPGISFKESVNNPCSPRVRRENDRSTASRTIDVPWGDVEEFVLRAIGYSDVSWVTISGKQYYFITRLTPWPFPSNINDSMYVDSVDYEGRGIPQGTNLGAAVIQYDGEGNRALASYKLARCTLNYTTPTYEVLTDAEFAVNTPTMDESTWRRYVTKIVKPQGEFLTISGTNNGYYVARIQTGSGGAFPVSTTINKIIAACNYSVTWHQIPANAVPMSEYNPAENAAANVNFAIDQCLGRVNNQLFNGCKTGTLLLLAVEIKPMKSAFGTRIYDITYMFKKFSPGEDYNIFEYKGAPAITVTPGHNHVFLPATRLTGAALFPAGTPSPGWYEVMGDSTRVVTSPYSNIISQDKGVNIYDYANFANLFRPVQWSGL